MKFVTFKEFRSGIVDATIGGIVEFLSVDMTHTLRDLQEGLTKLRFGDNFDAFIVEDLEFTAGEEKAIRNRLRGSLIPKHRLVIRGGDGSELVTDGDTTWTKDFVYLKNRGVGSVTVSVVFLR